MTGSWVSILPPLLAIALALITRQVLPSLIVGGYCGALVLAHFQPLTALLRLGDHFLVGALADHDHATIVLFTTILGGMVGVMAAGGMSEGLVRALAGKVSSRPAGQTSTAIMGTVIFFDDYANTLLVGTTMRPLTDRLRISREKLAYLVDSTAAPVTALAVVSTWIGFEVGLIQEALVRGGQDGGSAYAFFVQCLPYSFYPVLTLVMVYLVATTGRDFGPMFTAEARAWQRDEAAPLAGARGTTTAPLSPLLGLLPVATVIATTALGLWLGGRQEAIRQGIASPSLRDVLNHADSYAVLMWAAVLGALMAAGIALGSRRLSLAKVVDGFMSGCQSMLVAIAILILAWTLSAVCADLGTADFVVGACQGALSAHLLPAVTFLIAAVVSFATGTSWGTMAILMPLVFPLGLALPAAEGVPAGVAQAIHLATVRAVMAGAVFGDHCSPISDTTIMSSLASSCEHVDHVRTQLPYALAVAGIAIVCGYLPAGWGMSPVLGNLVGAAVVAGLVVVLGRNPARS